MLKAHESESCVLVVCMKMMSRRCGVRLVIVFVSLGLFVFFQAEDGIRDLVRSRGLGDVYKRQVQNLSSSLYLLSNSQFHCSKYSERKN